MLGVLSRFEQEREFLTQLIGQLTDNSEPVNILLRLGILQCWEDDKSVQRTVQSECPASVRSLWNGLVSRDALAEVVLSVPTHDRLFDEICHEASVLGL